MSLQFIIGGSGCGKTRRLFDDIIRRSLEEPDRRFFLLVPEQFTMQTQKDIVELHPRHGVMNIDIVSFERLAYRVFEELGIKNPVMLDDCGKSMVIRKVAGSIKDKLKVYGGKLDKNGFISEIKSMMSEFYQYGYTADDVEKLASECSRSLLAGKLNDMSVVLRAFDEFTEGRMIIKEELLQIFCNCLPSSELLKGAVIGIDGFTGFTPVQYRVLEHMLQMAEKVTVTVTMSLEEDSVVLKNLYSRVPEEDLFYLSHETIVKLIDIASMAGVSHMDDILIRDGSKGRLREVPELMQIEKFLYRGYGKKFEPFADRDEVSVTECANPVEEARYIAGQVNRLVRESGFRYREIAVISGALEDYRKVFIREFSDADIPYFIDDKRNILSNPLVLVIKSALEAISTGYSYESVFRYLKSGLVVDEAHKDICLSCENYVLALGIKGYKRWNEEWTGIYGNSEAINFKELNEFREYVIRPFDLLREVFSERNSSIKDKTEALVKFLVELKLQEKMAAMADTFADAGDNSHASEYEKAWEKVMELFDRVTMLLGEEPCSQKDYLEILDSGFQEIRVGIIPAANDRVVIGDIRRTRLAGIKAIFFAGVNEGIVPSAGSSGGILSESERRLLKDSSVMLAPTVKENAYLERFYLYMALTKAEKRLCISYCTNSSDGKSLRPSKLIGELGRILGGIEVREPDWDGVRRWSAEQSIDHIAELLRTAIWDEDNGNDDGELPAGAAGSCGATLKEAYQLYLKNPEFADQIRNITEAAFYSYTDRGLGKAAASSLYGKLLSGSVTRMEQFASCAYAHFLQYGLELSDRQQYELNGADIGTLYHGAIDRYFKLAASENRSVRDISEEDRETLVKRCVEETLGGYGNSIMESSARNRYYGEKLLRVCNRTIWAITEQLKAGDFEPTGIELEFNDMNSRVNLRIPVGDDSAISLRGRIDRLDTCVEDDAILIKVVDYKTGNKKFDITESYYGLNLQLVVYLSAAAECLKRDNPDKRIVPAGLFYYHIDDPVIDKKAEMTEEETRAEILKNLRVNGLVNGDPKVLYHLDHRLNFESDFDSNVVPVAIRKNTLDMRKSSVAESERFQVLEAFVKEKLKAMGTEILDGKISVNPHKFGSKDGCQYCGFRKICGFDPKIPGYKMRRLASIKDEELWDRIYQEAGRRPEGVKPGEKDLVTSAGIDTVKVKEV